MLKMKLSRLIQWLQEIDRANPDAHAGFMENGRFYYKAHRRPRVATFDDEERAFVIDKNSAKRPVTVVILNSDAGIKVR